MPPKSPPSSQELNKKALFYSAFVFPGSGLLMLGLKPRYKKLSLIFCGVCAVLSLVVMIDAIMKAHRVANEFAAGLTNNGVIDPEKLLANLGSLPAYIRSNLAETAGLLPANLGNLLFYSLIGFWLVGLILTYHQRKKD